MVVMGSSRAPGEGRPVCSVAWARQCVHLQQQNTKAGIKMAAQSGDSLPVVELRPFTKQVWRREKSLPNFYEKHVAKEESNSESSRKAGGETPPNIVRFIRELGEQRKTVGTQQSVDSTQRYRSKLHPKADFTFEGRVVSAHQQDLIPSFTTRRERTKTALMGVQGEDIGTAAAASAAGGGPTAGLPVMAGREVSNLLAAYTRDKPLHQQSQVCLKGGKLSGYLGRRPLLYLKPFSAYNKKQPWTVCRDENSPIRFSPRNAVSLSLSRGSGGMTSSANGVGGRRDLVLSGSTFCTQDRAPPLQPLRVGHHSPHKFSHKLGAAHDSLSLLSRNGAPTVLERNLSYDMELKLEQCRRERSFATIGETNVLSTAHYVAYDSQPTRGEITLMRAREANKSRDGKTTYRRNGLQKPLGVVPRALNNTPHMSVMLARAPEHNVSPRSRSDQDDSGIQSSAGDAMDEAPKMGEFPAVNGLVFPRDLGEEVILEQPGDCDEHFDDKDGAQIVWDAAQTMWVPAESVQLVPEDSEQSGRTNTRPEQHQCDEKAQAHTESDVEKEAVSKDTRKSRQSNNSKAALKPRKPDERPKSDTVLVGASKQNDLESPVDSERYDMGAADGQKDSSRIDGPKVGGGMKDSSSMTENESDNNETSGHVMPEAESEALAPSQIDEEAENASEDCDVHSTDQNSHTEQLPGTDGSDADDDDSDTNDDRRSRKVKHRTKTVPASERLQGGETTSKTFKARQPVRERPSSGLVANDMELESVASTNRSSPPIVDSGRDPVKDKLRDDAAANAVSKGQKPYSEQDDPQKDVYRRKEGQDQPHDGIADEETDKTTSENPTAKNETAKKESNHGDQSFTSEGKVQSVAAERRQSQVSGLPVCYNKQKEDVTVDSGTVQQSDVLTENEGLLSDTPVESNESNLGAPHIEKGKAANDGELSTKVEHEPRKDEVVLEKNDDVNVTEDVPSEKLEETASVSAANADGFEDEKTFLTTTNVETDDWQSLVKV